LLNTLRDQITTALEIKKQQIATQHLNDQLSREKIDVTLPARPSKIGSLHPLSSTLFEIIQLFNGMGFRTVEGPEIENDTNNFTDLNIPESHPARQSADTFYLSDDEQGKRVLRTHTSPVQIRTMKAKRPPMRIIAPGRVFRSDYDQTHTPNFHQIEGLYVDKVVHMGHLKSCLQQFFAAFFEVPDLKIRFRPSYFPFTEPSAEVDIACSIDKGILKMGGDGQWLEVGGCGMVHPNVLRNCDIDPHQFQGFAFGMGIERLTMLKYGIPDLRSFYDTDVRWLNHFGQRVTSLLARGN